MSLGGGGVFQGVESPEKQVLTAGKDPQNALLGMKVPIWAKSTSVNGVVGRFFREN